MRAHSVPRGSECPTFPAEGTGRNMALLPCCPEASAVNLYVWVCRMEPVTPQVKKILFLLQLLFPLILHNISGLKGGYEDRTPVILP